MRWYQFSIQSELRAEPEAVWSYVTTLRGVNEELRPWLRMTYPEADLGIDDPRFTTGQRLFRSWLFLFGLVPVDYDDIVVASIEPGRAFSERSTMLTQRAWHHDRSVSPTDRGCVVTDSLRWSPRIPGAGLLYRVFVPFLFGWRHRQLTRRFGAPGETHG